MELISTFKEGATATMISPLGIKEEGKSKEGDKTPSVECKGKPIVFGKTKSSSTPTLTQLAQAT